MTIWAVFFFNGYAFQPHQGPYRTFDWRPPPPQKPSLFSLQRDSWASHHPSHRFHHAPGVAGEADSSVFAGIGHKVVVPALITPRSGHWSIQRQLDLHGLRVDEACEALGDFIRRTHQVSIRCVRVMHGKGLKSPGKPPVLKSRGQRWLVPKNEVLVFVQARPMDGGADRAAAVSTARPELTSTFVRKR